MPSDLAKASSKIVDFAEKIKLAIAKKANTQYAYYKMLKSAKNNSQYALFFSTKHILGAEKFLEALDKIEEKDLFENTISDKDNAFIKMISSKKKLNNCDLHKYGLLSSLLPKRVNIILKELEKNENIIVFPKIKNRRKGNFYIGYKYCKKRPRLEIEFK